MSRGVHDSVKTTAAQIAEVEGFERDPNYHYALVPTTDPRPGMPKPTDKWKKKGYDHVEGAPENCEYRVLMRIPLAEKQAMDRKTLDETDKLLGGDPTGKIPVMVDGAETIAESKRGETKTMAEVLLNMPEASPKPRQGSK